MRTLLQHRAALIAHRAPPIFPMQKALQRMHFQGSAGLTDLPGVTGQAILRARVPGARDPLRLAPFPTVAGKASTDVMAQALTGTWRDAQGCILTHALELFDFSTRQLAACDAQSARQWAAMQPRFTADEPCVPGPRVKRARRRSINPAPRPARLWRASPAWIASRSPAARRPSRSPSSPRSARIGARFPP